MHRCAIAGLTALAALAFALPAALVPDSAAAQTVQARTFPRNALRGDLQFGVPPEVLVNGQPARLAPGARIRGANNLLILSGALAGSSATANYTLDGMGQLHDVWILTPEEAAHKPWPSTPAEAQSWAFDPSSQTWSKP
jgi:hypothetical protein